MFFISLAVSSPTDATILKPVVMALLRKDATILSAQKELRAKFYEYPEARSQLLPQISLKASRQNQSNNILSSSSVDDFAGRTLKTSVPARLSADLVQPLWRGGTLLNALKRADALIQQAFYKYYATLSREIYTIIAVLIDIQEQQRIIGIATTDIARKRKMLTQVGAKVEVGQSLESDLYEAQARLFDSEQRLITAQHRLAEFKAKYRELTGLEPSEISASKCWSIGPQPNFKHLRQMAEKRNFDIMVQQKALDVAMKELAISKGAFSPTLSLRGGADYNNIAGQRMRKAERHLDLKRDETVGLSAGLEAEWGIFNGFRDTARYQKAAEGKRAATSALYAVVQKVRNELTSAQESYQAAYANQSRIIQTRDGYQKAFDLYAEQYAAGQRSFHDFGGIDDRLLVSELSLARNERELRGAYYLAISLSGQLTPELWGITDTFQPDVEYRRVKASLF